MPRRPCLYEFGAVAAGDDGDEFKPRTLCRPEVPETIALPGRE